MIFLVSSSSRGGGGDCYGGIDKNNPHRTLPNHVSEENPTLMLVELPKLSIGLELPFD